MGEKTVALEWRMPVNGERAVTVSDADASLVTRFVAGDRHAFDSLFVKYQEYVYNIVLGILGRQDEARDVTQEVFVQVYRSLPAFRHGARFATWLYRIAVNRAVDAARSAKNRKWFALDEALRTAPDPADSPVRSAERGADREAVQRVLAQVPVQHRDVLVLRYYQDLSVDEIAEILRCSVTAAKVRLHRARHHFKEKYIETFGQEAGGDSTLP